MQFHTKRNAIGLQQCNPESAFQTKNTTQKLAQKYYTGLAIYTDLTKHYQV